MDFRKRLKELSRPVMVESVYLAGRYLIHGLTRDLFLQQLEADVKTKYRDQSVDVVLGIIDSIEASTGAPVGELSMGRRFELATGLDDVLWEDIEQKADDNRVEDTLAALRTQH